MNRTQALRELELLENYEFDRGDAPVRLLLHLGSEDLEVVVVALRASASYLGLPGVWERVFELSQKSPDEEVRAAASASLWPVLQDGSGWDWKPPAPGASSDEEEDEDEDDEDALLMEVGEPQVPREIYEQTKSHLLARVQSGMESLEVRRRCLEALGHVAFLPEIKALVLKYYKEASTPWVKVSALYAMGQQDDDDFARIVLAELHATHSAVLVEAIHAAATMGLEESWPLVATHLHDSNADVRFEARAAIGLLAPLTEAHALIETIARDHADSDTREALEIARSTLVERIQEETGEDDGWRMDQVWDEIDRMTDSSPPPPSDDEDRPSPPRRGPRSR